VLDRFIGETHCGSGGEGGKIEPGSAARREGPEDEYGQEAVLDQVDPSDRGRNKGAENEQRRGNEEEA